MVKGNLADPRKMEKLEKGDRRRHVFSYRHESEIPRDLDVDLEE